MARTSVSEGQKSFNPAELVQRARDSLQEKLNERREEVRAKLEEGIGEVRAELERVAEPILGKKLPKDFGELLRAMEKDDALGDFVTPEIQELCDQFEALLAEANGGKPKRNKRKPAERGRPRKENGGIDAAAEGDEELDERDQIILERARKDGFVKNDPELRHDLDMLREGVLMRLKKLVKHGLLERGEKEGQAGVIVFTISGKHLAPSHVEHSGNGKDNPVQDQRIKVLVGILDKDGSFQNKDGLNEKLGIKTQGGASQFLQKMVAAGVLKMEGSRRFARYVAGPGFKV